MNSYPHKPVVDRPKTISQGGCHVNRILGLLLLLLCAVGLSVRAAADTFKAISVSLLPLESCQPGNGYIDPGETNSVLFAIQNTSGGDLKNVKVSLLGDSLSAVFPQTGEQAIGDIAKDAVFTVTFRFRANGGCGETLKPTLHFTSDTVSAQDLQFTGSNNGARLDFQLGATVNPTYSFSNNSAIAINDFNPGNSDNPKGKASPYPSTLSVTGIPNDLTLTGERVTGVNVTLNNITHGWSPDIQVLLVGPKKQAIVLMAKAGGVTAPTAPINNVTLTFSDGASGQLPGIAAGSAQISSGTYKASNFESQLNAYPFVNPDDFPGIPSGLTLVSGLSGFNALDANGTWQLFVQDIAFGNTGTIAGGWRLDFTTTKIVCCGAGQTFPTIVGLSDTNVNEDAATPDSPIQIGTFNINDIETGADGLTLTAASSNTAVVTAPNLIFGGSNNNRTISLKQNELHQFGDTTITVTVTDPQGHSGSQSFKLSVNFKNHLPTISSILNQSFTKGQASPPVSFVVGDVETDPSFLVVTWHSSDQAVVADSAIFPSGSGANRSITLTPGGSTAPATILLKVTDSNGDSTTVNGGAGFVVQFNANPGFPTITPIGATVTDENKSVTIPFNVRSSTSTAAGSLSVAVTQNTDTSLLPSSGISFGGSDTSRTVTLAPAANHFGSTTITLTVTDPATGLTQSTQFILTVNFVNQAPSITSIANQIINEDSANGTGDIQFFVSDAETASANLAVTASVFNTDNPNLVNSITVGPNPFVSQNRTVKVTANPNEFGRAAIKVTVTDSGPNPASTSTTFLVTVNAVNDIPLVTTVAVNAQAPIIAQTVNADGGTLNVFEDAGSAITDSSDHNVVVHVQGISPGPANESSQTVSITASSSDTSVVSIDKIDPTSRTGLNQSSDITLRLKATKSSPDPLKPIVITLTLTDNGGTDFGGVNTKTAKFNVNVQPVNYVPTITINPSGPGAIDLNNVPKNKAVSIPVDIKDKETPTPLITVSAKVLTAADRAGAHGDPDSAVQAILFDINNAKMTIVLSPNMVVAHLPYTLDFRVTATDQTVGSVAAQTVTQDFTIVVKDIEPPTIGVAPTTVSFDEDNVGLTVLTIHDNHALATELQPLQDITDAACKAAIGSSKQLYATSDNQTLLPDSGILFGNLNAQGVNDGTRTLAIVPAVHKFGTANVVITAVDDECLRAITTFKVEVRGVPHAPTITRLKALAGATVTVDEDKATADSGTDSKLLEFDVDDVDTSPSSVTVTVDSSNKDVVPLANIVIGNQGASGTRRTLTITSGSHQFGSSTITLTATDPGGLSVSTQFTLQVNHVNQAPTIDTPGNLSLSEDAPEQTVTLTNVTPGPANEQSGGAAPQAVTISWIARDKGTKPEDNVNGLVQGGTATHVLDSSAIDVSGKKGTLKFTPIAHASGITTIYVTITDIPSDNNPVSDNTKAKSTTVSFDVAIAFGNHAPTLSFSSSSSVKTASINIGRDGSGKPLSSVVTAVYINDVEQAGVDLTLTAVSSNPILIPNDPANLQLGGSGNNRGIIILPANSQNGGTSTVTLTVTDKNGATDAGTITVNLPASSAPTISAIPNQTIHVNEFTDLIQFTVSDAQTPADQIQVFAGGSSNTAVVPLSPNNIQFGGSGSSRAMIVLPAANQTGTSIITVSAKDGDGNVTSTTFTLSVLGAPPTISAVSNQDIGLGVKGPTQSFQVSSQNTFPGFLTVTGKSSNQGVVPDQNVFILGSTGTRSVTILTGNTAGAAIITLTVADNSGQTASTTFTVNVADNNTPPTISPIAEQSTQVNRPTGLITFVVGDKETQPGSLVVTVTSSNTGLVPNTSILVLQTPSNPASRSMIITPAQNQSGKAIITVTVTDGGNKSTSTTFVLNVSTVVVANDFNGDGVPDIILQDKAGFVGAWFMSGDIEISATFLTPNNVGDLGWKIVDSGDFDGDGKPDLLFQYSDGTLAVWKMDGTKLVSASALDPSNSGSPDWQAIAVGDFNGDGKPDILLQNTNGSLAVWLMNGLKMTSISALVPSGPGDPNWRAVGVADINGDKNLDIVFQHADGTLGVWYLKGGTNLLLSALLNPSNPGSADWRVAGITDLNGDGKADLLLQNRASGDVGIWFMKGPDLIIGKTLTPSNPGGSWQIVAP